MYNDPKTYNPDQCGYDPLPEGSQTQRMEPQVERLVILAERVGYLNSQLLHSQKGSSLVREELDVTKRDVDQQRVRGNNWRDMAEKAEARALRAERQVKRLKPKTAKKGK